MEVGFTNEKDDDKMNRFTFLIFTAIVLFGANLIAQEQVVKSFTGSGGKNTRPFTVSAGWEIQWDAEGDFFQLYLYGADGSMVGVAANQPGSGKGTSYQAKSGNYYLQVNAMGNWTITIVQVSSIISIGAPSSQQIAQNPNLIAAFTGSGGKNTRPFSVPAGWEIQWDAEGDIFQLFLYQTDGSMVGVAANQQGSGKGTSYQAKSGKYFLQVNAMGNWKIAIVIVKKE